MKFNLEQQLEWMKGKFLISLSDGNRYGWRESDPRKIVNIILSNRNSDDSNFLLFMFEPNSNYQVDYIYVNIEESIEVVENAT